GHSTKTTASSKYGSRSPHSAGETPSNRYRSRWDTGVCPSYLWPIVYVGLVTGPVTPRARHAPRTNVVFPDPSSPETVTTSPGRSSRASRAPAFSVSSGECDSTRTRRVLPLEAGTVPTVCFGRRGQSPPAATDLARRGRAGRRPGAARPAPQRAEARPEAGPPPPRPERRAAAGSGGSPPRARAASP